MSELDQGLADILGIDPGILDASPRRTRSAGLKLQMGAVIAMAVLIGVAAPGRIGLSPARREPAPPEAFVRLVPRPSPDEGDPSAGLRAMLARPSLDRPSAAPAPRSDRRPLMRHAQGRRPAEPMMAHAPGRYRIAPPPYAPERRMAGLRDEMGPEPPWRDERPPWRSYPRRDEYDRAMEADSEAEAEADEEEQARAEERAEESRLARTQSIDALRALLQR